MDEYIKREDLLELYRIDDPVLNENGHVPLPVVRQNIMDIPAADVAPVRHGRWERTADGAALCTACKRKMNPSQYGYAFCGLCGAKMDGGEDR